ncbi:hypothetical protein NDU88_009766 [Pleurodeles waltl]|uniref:Secreted protein n=1 Tax=Pleurodeles waltl TaxID=8319 RepID=A0AAV7PU54_PLEWA|nr:hypothetical protein NDU88_009766 [Pleurodeles waltl]
MVLYMRQLRGRAAAFFATVFKVAALLATSPSTPLPPSTNVSCSGLRGLAQLRRQGPLLMPPLSSHRKSPPASQQSSPSCSLCLLSQTPPMIFVASNMPKLPRPCSPTHCELGRQRLPLFYLRSGHLVEEPGLTQEPYCLIHFRL